jgi:hypothetical protein
VGGQAELPGGCFLYHRHPATKRDVGGPTAEPVKT